MIYKYTSLFWILNIILLAYGADKLVVQELTSTFTGSGWSPNTISQCQTGALTEFSNQNVMGFFGLGSNTSTKTFTNIPPHWSLSIRFDLLLYQSLDSSDYVYVKINGNIDAYQKDNPDNGYFRCISTNVFFFDEVVLYYRNFTHSDSSISVTLFSQTDEAISNEGFGFNNFYLYVDTCHDSCSTCTGPTATQCLTCPTNSIQNGNKCICNNGYSAQNNQCIQICQSGYTKDSTGKICVQDFCSNTTCDTCQNGLCISCKSGFYLLNGQCVSSCPSYSTQSGQQCMDIISQTQYGGYLLKSMFNTYFGESEIIGSGLNAIGFLGNINTSSRALTTVCNGKTILGGAYLSSKNSLIQAKFNSLQPHRSVTIGYTLYKIDAWNQEYVQLIVDGDLITVTIRNMFDGGVNLCGKIQYNDQIIKVSQKFSHSKNSLELNISSGLNSDPFTESYGIRELFILVDYCSPNCLQCDNQGCNKCQQGLYLYNYQCVLTCPDSFVTDANKICQPCDFSCYNCFQPLSSTSCLTCQPNTYLNPNNSCLNNCPSKYWANNSNLSCQACDATCYNCQNPGDSNSCTNCNGQFYLLYNKCIAICPPNTFAVAQTNNNICQSCDLSCKTCDGPNSNNCLSCQSPMFYQQTSKTCVSSCNQNQFQSNQICYPCDSSCNTCSGPSYFNCLSCSGNTFLYQNQCITNCPVKYYNNSQNNQCSPCDSTCYTCNGNASNNCLSCELQRYFDFQSNKCVLACNSNQYPDLNTISCKQCDSSCKSCNGSTASNCTDCRSGLFLQNNQCKSICDGSYFGMTQTNTCQPCHLSCFSCNGSSINNCLSCQAPRYFDPTTNQCVLVCNSNQYPDLISNLCKQCDSTCLSCNGPYIYNCTSCRSGLFLQNNFCKQTCDSSYFGATQTNTCQPCQSPCKTCDGPNSNNCLSCQTPTFYQQISKICSNQCSQCDSSCYTCNGSSSNNCLSCELQRYFDPQSSKCITSCNSNQYPDVSSNLCKVCDSSCLTCNGSYSSNCTSCRQGLFLQNNQCKQNCDGSYFGESVTKTCQPCDQSCKTCDGSNNANNQVCSSCDSSCATCSGPSNFNCLSCSLNKFLYLNQCFTNCPVRFYNNAQSNQCSQCDSSCYTCNGSSSNNCLSCELQRYFDPQSSKCLSSCNSNQYPDISTNLCKICDPSCLTCNGSQSSNCTSCRQGLFLQNNQCKQSCDGSYYAESLTKICQPCDQSCKICDGPYNTNNQICSSCDPSCATCSGSNSFNCLSCSSNKFLYLNQCITNCPVRFYNNTQNNQCFQCDSSCYTCNGSASNNCLSCELQRYFDPQSNKCLISCNSNQYPDVSSNLCKVCDSSCLTCNGSQSSNCTSCRQGLFLQNNQCKQICNGSYFGESVTKTCQACDQSCKTCDGPNSNNCLSCQAPKFYQQTSKICVSQCNQNQFQDTNNQICSSCDPSCATCSGPSNFNCLSCSLNQFLYLNQCVTNCPVKFYNNVLSNQCSLCDSSCYTCNGSTSNNCLSCELQRYFDPQSSKCLTSCNSNQYHDVNSNKCIFCDPSCLTCNGPQISNCTSCISGQFLQNNQCKSSCDGSYFGDTVTKTCQPCDQSCKTCDGPNNNNCLSCQAPNLFYQQNNTCVFQCKLNQFQDRNNQICSSCHPTCSSCTGPNDISCLTCSGKTFLYQNQCVSNCPKKFFSNTQNNQCTPCDSTCYTCDGSSSNNCLSCQLQRYLDPALNQCVQVCNSNQYPDIISDECKQCDISCLSCNGPYSSNCTSCRQGLFQLNNTCVQDCGDNNFVIPQTNICQNCYLNCKTCSGPSSSQCNSCLNGFIFLNNSCHQNCPSNYYDDQQQMRECKLCNSYCKEGCGGPLIEDCDSIKYKYQIILYILATKSFLWIFTSIISFFKDKKQSKVFVQVMNQPNTIETDRVSKSNEKKDNNQMQIDLSQIQQTPNKISIEEHIKQLQQPSKIQNFQVQKEFNKVIQNQNSKRRPRKLINKNDFYQQSQKPCEFSQINLQSNQLSMIKSTNQIVPTISNLITASQVKNQNDLEVQDVTSITSKKYSADKLFKFTMEMSGCLCFTFIIQ
ncbi:zinc finger lsd1 subclass family protein (macronuclear) [Tetrahymena thermophila SB210]|uniref:Zinc finger lsd1 subclass family protein n=1 Tax=Tetrahymena thermophila (strain SB210) TaxID=312017 RepID=Q22Z13_TETTS|nr:zinc finger lsd1 subclass family protein [Tetrahymena thermophila SB210]EAR90508.3 zinc finger lsd1 subclass family protein [Tetrahymena thermophila SB210]|eukprot:XP_001010753.3 zinc finger lsd1 subclass family protein [Tetrahymena thermophila SB210]